MVFVRGGRWWWTEGQWVQCEKEHFFGRQDFTCAKTSTTLQAMTRYLFHNVYHPSVASDEIFPNDLAGTLPPVFET